MELIVDLAWMIANLRNDLKCDFRIGHDDGDDDDFDDVFHHDSAVYHGDAGSYYLWDQ